jgi:hypothetical protein
MKKMLLLTVLFVNSAFASDSCFIAKENGIDISNMRLITSDYGDELEDDD